MQVSVLRVDSSYGYLSIALNDTKTKVAVGMSGKIQIYDAFHFFLVASITIEEEYGWVISLVFDHDDLYAGTELVTKYQNEKPVWSCRLHEDEDVIGAHVHGIVKMRQRLACACDQVISVLDADTGNILERWRGHQNSIKSFKQMVSCGLDHGICCWNEDGTMANKIMTFFRPYDASISLCRQYIAVVGLHTVFMFFKGKIVWSNSTFTFTISKVLFSPHDQWIVIIHGSNIVLLWAQTGDPYLICQGHTSNVAQVVWMDDHTLLSSARDGTLRTWRIGQHDQALGALVFRSKCNPAVVRQVWWHLF